ncbi:Methylthioribose-1-phosphate isomerase [Candidatus Desulfarcum epimagneticum]|uniref:Methylthioribose-1-phosphate isomerase n=1 Tax=uncultured Desulfobacteraceae bacterium TaxID=218296 RepID=A0A484HHH6_9BACT|nr:Methylthioribose-1-phosphate isomerase [uncultured Desulfobacteraceae bacterium]
MIQTQKYRQHNMKMEKKTPITRPIWLDEDSGYVRIIDQRLLPHQLVLVDLKTVDDVITAIRDMYVRGAPLIGAAGAFGIYIAALSCPRDAGDPGAFITEESRRLKSVRPTAVNLAWAVDRTLAVMAPEKTLDAKTRAALDEARRIADEESENCRKIGEHGLPIIEEISRKKNGETVHILTHCNAGWLACVEYGTATAPIYAAFDKGIDVHVWVDETRPLNQGARLTAWELGRHGVKHTVITDNAGGILMARGMVDAVIVGTDRTTRAGDVANKVGTYLKALAAKDNGVPFYVALPSSTFDWELDDGARIPIEERSAEEIRRVAGFDGSEIREVLIAPEDSPCANFAFDVTPARLVTGLITERGICQADAADIRRLFPDKRA